MAVETYSDSHELEHCLGLVQSNNTVSASLGSLSDSPPRSRYDDSSVRGPSCTHAHVHRVHAGLFLSRCPDLQLNRLAAGRVE